MARTRSEQQFSPGIGNGDPYGTIGNKGRSWRIIWVPTVGFEGSTSDQFETLLQAIDPTADNVQKLPNSSGTLMSVIDASAFDDFDDAVTAAAGKTLYISTAISITDDTTIPSTVHVVVANEGSFVITAAKILTMPVPEAGHYQIYSGAGEVRFSNAGALQAVPQWWGLTLGTDCTAAFKACIQAVIYATSVTFGTVKRDIPSIYIPSGSYLVDNNTFSSYTQSDIRTLNFKGAGMYNTTIILNADGALMNLTTGIKMLFPVFRDIGFYGDIYLDTAANDVTHPVSSLRKFIWANTTGIQGFRFFNCLFSRFGETFVMEGSNNDSEFKFFGCKATKLGDWLISSNDQLFNWNHFGTDIDQYVGSLVRIPATDYSGDGGEVSGGGAISFFGGNIIPFDSGSPRYLVEIYTGTNVSSQPNVQFNGCRIELRYDNNGIFKGAPIQQASVYFNDCSFLSVLSASGTKEWCSIGAGNNLRFKKCGFVQEAAATNEWTLVGNANIYNDQGTLVFDECQGVPDVTEIILDATGTYHGIAYAINTRTTNPIGSTYVEEAPNWTVTDDWWKFHGRDIAQLPIHRLPFIRNYAPNNASDPATFILPENAVILRVWCLIIPQTSTANNITYSLDDGDATNFFTVGPAAQNAGAYFEKFPSDFGGGIGQAVIGATTNARTLTLSASADATHVRIRGVGFIEYV